MIGDCKGVGWEICLTMISKVGHRRFARWLDDLAFKFFLKDTGWNQFGVVFYM